MRRFKRILLVLGDGLVDTPVDTDFLDFAPSEDATVTVAAWCTVPAPSLLASLLDWRNEPVEAYVRLGLQKALDAAAETLRRRGVAVDTVVLEGDPAEAVLNLIEAAHFDLVVKPAEGAGADAAFTYGPFDRALIRHSPVPVLIAKPHPERAPNVLVAVDVNNPESDRLNDALIEMGLTQAAQWGGELHVAHSWELQGEAALRSGAFTEISQEAVQALKAKERAARHDALQALFARHADTDVQMVEHLVEGPAALAMTAVAKAVQPRLLIMGVTPRRRLASLVLNDFAQAMLAAVDCSVLLVNAHTFAETRG